MDTEKDTRENYRAGVKWHIEKSLKYNVDTFIDIFCEELKGNKVLEIGIGAGRDIQHFVKRGVVVEGVDYSQGFIDHCKYLFPDLKCRLGDVRELKLDEGSYDGIWAFASLLNMPKKDLKVLLPRLRKCLRKEGIIFISLKEGEGERMVEDIAGRRFFSFYKLDELRKIAEDSGFKTIYTDRRTNYDLTGREGDKPGWISFLGRKV